MKKWLFHLLGRCPKHRTIGTRFRLCEPCLIEAVVEGSNQCSPDLKRRLMAEIEKRRKP